MKAHLLTIGDELLIGQSTNTNAAWLGERLSRLGLRVERIVTVGDDRSTMATELHRAVTEARLVILTGGLGPTHDDVTREVLAEYFDAPLRQDDGIMDRIRTYYERRGRQLPRSAPKLAQVPVGFETLDNPVGAAVGLWYETSVNGEERMVAALPGIPEEMQGIFESAIEPRVEATMEVRSVTHRTLVTAGIAESALQERLNDLVDRLGDGLNLAYLPSTSGVRLRLTAVDDDPVGVADRLDHLEDSIRDRVEEHIIGMGDVTLEEVVGEKLRKTGRTVASAESATGGLIGHRLTSVSGSSDYYVGSVVAYANDVKQSVLDVSPEMLQEYGAVSEPVALQMAVSVRERLESTVGVATTGIAGPGGGTREKPVGTVWLGYADPTRTRAVRRHFVEDRTLNKQLFASAALDLVRQECSV